MNFTIWEEMRVSCEVVYMARIVIYWFWQKEDSELAWLFFNLLKKIFRDETKELEILKCTSSHQRNVSIDKL